MTMDTGTAGYEGTTTPNARPGADTPGSTTGTATGSTDWTGSTDRLQDAAGGLAGRAADTAQREIETRASGQLSRASEMLGQVAQVVRQSGDQVRSDQPQVADLAESAATQVDKASEWLRETDLRHLIGDAEDFARRQPALFLGAAFALGLAASRFLRAAPERPVGRLQLAPASNQSYAPRTYGRGTSAAGTGYGVDAWSTGAATGFGTAEPAALESPLGEAERHGGA